MKTKVTSIILTLCLVAPTIATYSWLQYKKAAVRKEVYSRMYAEEGRKELVLLSFTREASRTDLRWTQAREFEYNHQKYDIVDSMTKGDSVFYWCWWDHAETRLSQHLNDLVSNIPGQDSPSTKHQKRLANFYKSLFHSNTYQFPLAFSNPGRKAVFSYGFPCQSISKPPPSPPPEVF
ncbi:MAG: hypothetical protein H6563_09655 [Lewinellaceae bacterium]|nr:hypothetical protein [Lewinellaceae bacterium]